MEEEDVAEEDCEGSMDVMSPGKLAGTTATVGLENEESEDEMALLLVVVVECNNDEDDVGMMGLVPTSLA